MSFRVEKHTLCASIIITLSRTPPCLCFTSPWGRGSGMRVDDGTAWPPCQVRSQNARRHTHTWAHGSKLLTSSLPQQQHSQLLPYAHLCLLRPRVGADAGLAWSEQYTLYKKELNVLLTITNTQKRGRRRTPLSDSMQPQFSSLLQLIELEWSNTHTISGTTDHKTKN